ncbi:IclR family transcriptional regulator [Brevibacillus agri]|uniref:Glycerol operon regulatory protein n=1 Tax=Brevibacillus agri TaxID=51101 RepID=A0A3M8A9J8_9BACL|nr:MULTISPECIES: IclR family transcriptional regulator [Brevibacillus]EJL39181.1 transcriptional regulator [Brevibacillus sp. CF112]MBG9567650.1 transcriptional regulator [Brevibacillus agri]MBY0054866.1 IclR family transcriptional regulator [Brevibacillus agri]MCG5254793.1 IclR family transcriptional regulator [Brevibacillus agri]MDN4095322.1 IclR family transcriptional regulator [Brevibacillus agri]
MDQVLSSVRNGCRLLKMFLDSPKELGVTELSKKLQLSKGAVHKLLSTLESEGFIRQNEKTKQYTLGYTLLELGTKVLTNHDIVDFSKPFLTGLVSRVNELAVLCVQDSKDAIYVAKEDSKHPIRFTVESFRRFPLYSTTAARVLLAYQPESFQDEILAEQPLKMYTPHSYTSIEEVKADLQAIRERGYEISSNRRNTGVTGIAAPIFDSTGQVTASISVIGPTDRVMPKKEEIIQETLATVRDMSTQLGYRLP